MDSLTVTEEGGEWVARLSDWPTIGRGDSELEAVKSLARALRNQLVTVREVLVG
jgi:hypothetical protein